MHMGATLRLIENVFERLGGVDLPVRRREVVSQDPAAAEREDVRCSPHRVVIPWDFEAGQDVDLARIVVGRVVDDHVVKAIAVEVADTGRDPGC
jgi:hypothetical protein